MGLDCSHNAFHGRYSHFNELRDVVARVSDIPWVYDIQPIDGWIEVPDEIEVAHPGLIEFLFHADDTGDISPQKCRQVADELEALMPRLEAMDDQWYARRVRQFIEGCRLAHERGENLEFR